MAGFLVVAIEWIVVWFWLVIIDGTGCVGLFERLTAEGLVLSFR